MIMIIVTPRAMDDVISAMVPRGAAKRSEGDRVYRLYSVPQGTPRSQEFSDLDGDVLVSSHSFTSKLDALNWVDQDAAQRKALLNFVAGVVQ